MLDKKKIRDTRLEKKIPLKEMAKKMEVHTNCYLNYEKGRRTPSVEKVMKIAKILEVDWKGFYTND